MEKIKNVMSSPDTTLLLLAALLIEINVLTGGLLW